MILFSLPQYSYGDLEIDNTAYALRYGKSADFLDNRIGTRLVYEFSSFDALLNAIKDCVGRLFSSNNLAAVDIGSIIVVGQAKLSSQIPHLAARIHSLFGFPEQCLSLDLGHGCAGFIVGLDLAHNLANSLSKPSLLITCDPYRKILNPADFSTNLLFSDAVSATLVGENIGQFSCSNFQHMTYSELCNSIEYSQGSYLHMNGRLILDFGKRLVAPALNKYIENHILNSECIVLPHHGSRIVVDSLRRATSASTHVLWDESFRGNTISSSIPISISNLQKLLPTSSEFVMIGFGVGLSTSIVTSTRYDRQS